MRLMANADATRQGDFDGRGNLLKAALDEFVDYWVATCLDQITYMEELFNPTILSLRIRDAFEFISIRYSIPEGNAHTIYKLSIEGAGITKKTNLKVIGRSEQWTGELLK